MNKTQQLIADYYSLSKKVIAKEVFDYHIMKELECGPAVKGHKVEGSWSVNDTAKAFNVTIGMVSNWLNTRRREI